MIVAYIMAGAILGFHSLLVFSELVPGMNGPIPKGNILLMAFVGGVAGHLLFNLVYNT
jgi:hypothetical protein